MGSAEEYQHLLLADRKFFTLAPLMSRKSPHCDAEFGGIRALTLRARNGTQTARLFTPDGFNGIAEKVSSVLEKAFRSRLGLCYFIFRHVGGLLTLGGGGRRALEP